MRTLPKVEEHRLLVTSLKDVSDSSSEEELEILIPYGIEEKGPSVYRESVKMTRDVS